LFALFPPFILSCFLPLLLYVFLSLFSSSLPLFPTCFFLFILSSFVSWFLFFRLSFFLSFWLVREL
jgi:hypothetical protein